MKKSTTIRYKYRCGKGNLGWFQCDVEDFKALWKNKVFRSFLTWCKVDDGQQIHMWTKQTGWFIPKD